MRATRPDCGSYGRPAIPNEEGPHGDHRRAVAVDGDKLEQFVFRAVDEVGATLNAALVVIGDKLGLYRALAGAGPLTPAELAERTGTAERYVREWLNAQAAGGYVDYDPASGRYTLPPEQAVALTDEDSPAYLPGFFQIAIGLGARLAADHRGVPQRRRRRLARARPRRASTAPSASSGPATTRTWSPTWIPRSTASSRSSSAARRVADVGCGHGASTILMAQAFPNSTFVGFDYHDGVDRDGARARPRRPASPTGSRFEVAPRRRHSPAADYDLVTMFDCLHDMGDPVGAAATSARRSPPTARG